MKKCWKRLSVILIVVAAIAALSVTAVAASRQVTAQLYYNDIKITLDGNQIVPKTQDGTAVEPFIIDGTTYLPIRGVASVLGLNVDWDGTTGTVILTSPTSQTPTNQTPTSQQGGHAIYITKTGKKYHYDSTCNGGTYWEVPFATAIGFGLEPCDKCVHG